MHLLSLLYSIRRLLHVSASMFRLQEASYVLTSYLKAELVITNPVGQLYSIKQCTVRTLSYVITLLILFLSNVGLLILIACIIVECEWQTLKNRKEESGGSESVQLDSAVQIN
jgi:hypothetical protein